MGTDLTATMTGEARAGFLGAAVAPSGVTISLRPPRRSRCMGTRMVGVSSCGPVCSITVTDRLAMQIGLSLVFAALAGIGGYIGGRLEAARLPARRLARRGRARGREQDRGGKDGG